MDPDLRAALQSWHIDHMVVWLIPVTLLAYARGFWRVHVLMPQRYPLWRLASFGGALAVLFLAIASPLERLGELLLHVHMAQHMLLIMLAAPLIWLGQPLIPMLRCLPQRWVKRAFGPLLTSPALRRVGRTLTHPALCWIALAVTLVVWHVPRVYELGLRSDGWHALQHACFFGAALLFWWPVIGVWPSDSAWPRWTMIPYLVGADLINTALSAVLCFSGRVLYPAYETVPRLMGLSALDDQALAGVIMWVPGSIAFLLPAVLLTMRLFERQSGMHRKPSSALVRP